MKIIVDSKKIDIKNIRAYIPSLLLKLRQNNKWNMYHIKMFVYILSHFYKYKIKMSFNCFNNYNLEEINLNKIPRNLQISRNNIINLIKISRSHFARDIKNITQVLQSSVATLPNIHDLYSSKSYLQRNWFEEFSYNNKTGFLYIHIDKKVFPYLIVFCNYTRIYLSKILNFKSSYTFDTYIMLKLRLTKYKKYNTFEIDLSQYQVAIKLKNSYINNYGMFKKCILNRIINEINYNTDISVYVEEIKINKKISKIIFHYIMIN